MALDLNKFYNLGTLTKAQVDANWDAIIAAFGDADGLNQATPQEIIAMAAASIITPNGVGAALDWVPVDYGANIELDGSQFAQAEIVLEGDAQLDRPVNFDRGTKYVMVKGNNPTDRELTFDTTYFKGDLPILADVTDSRWYLLCIVAYGDSHYIVTSTRAL